MLDYVEKKGPSSFRELSWGSSHRAPSPFLHPQLPEWRHPLVPAAPWKELAFPQLAQTSHPEAWGLGQEHLWGVVTENCLMQELLAVTRARVSVSLCGTLLFLFPTAQLSPAVFQLPLLIS